ncbi:MAG: hypothetical protein ACLQUY_11520 [Ktedonobacterales bacterium]
MQRRTQPRTVRRDTITGLPVINPGQSHTGLSPQPRHSALEATFKAGSRAQLTAIVGMVLLLVTGTTFAITRAAPHGASASAHNAVVGVRSSSLTSVPIGTPLPSGYGPTLSDGSTPVISSPPADVTGEFCQQSYMFVPNISQWTVPPGCYATIYTPNPADFPFVAGFGYCNWWVQEQHLNTLDITEGSYPLNSTPEAGEAVWFDPGVQGASSDGHWAQLVAVSPGGYWLLISEMNFSWRGGGFGRVDYRYIHTGTGILFVEA